MWDGVTEEYERHLWDELNALLADVAEASEGDPADAILCGGSDGSGGPNPSDMLGPRNQPKS